MILLQRGVAERQAAFPNTPPPPGITLPTLGTIEVLRCFGVHAVDVDRFARGIIVAAIVLSLALFGLGVFVGRV